MKTIRVSGLVALTGFGISLVIGPGSAAERASEQLEEIVVTAQKRSESLLQAPVTVTAFTPEALADRGIGQVQGLANAVPNVEMNGGRADAAGSALAIYVRGVGQNDFLFPNDPGVGLYVDGVYFARSVGANLDLSDVERVEVLRGPQGTLYGKNTIGGAVNIYTTRPSLTEASGSVDLTGGSYNRHDLRASIDAPMVDGVLGFKLAAAIKRANGFMIRASDGKDLGDKHTDGLRGALRWRPNDAWDVSLLADWSRRRENGDAGFLANIVPSENLIAPAGAPTPFDPTPSTPTDLIDLFNALVAPGVNKSLGLPSGDRFDSRWLHDDRYRDYGTGAARNDDDVWGTSIDAGYTISDRATLRSISAYRKLKARFARDGDHSPYNIVQTNNDEDQNQLSEELQLTLTGPNDKWTWISGAFFMRERARDDNLVLLLNPITTALGGNPNLDWRPSSRISTDTWAVFSQLHVSLTPRLGTTIGGRYSDDRKRLYQRFTFDQFTYTDPYGNITNCYTCAADGITGRTLKKSWGAFTPQLGLDFRLSQNVFLYASLSRGFKSGGWSPRPTPTVSADQPFNPEYLDAVEVGAKSEWFERKLSVNFATFAENYRDVQLTTLQPNFALAVTNAGRSRLYGAELEVLARPVRPLDLNLSVGHLQNHYTRIDEGDPNFTRTDRLPDAPRWTLSTGAQYTINLREAGTLALRVDTAFRGKSWQELYNLRRDSVIQYFGTNATVTAVRSGSEGYLVRYPELAQPGYWLSSARITYRSTLHWELAGVVTNVANRKYVTSLLPVTAFGYDEGYYGRPREWGVTVGYRFGAH